MRHSFRKRVIISATQRGETNSHTEKTRKEHSESYKLIIRAALIPATGVLLYSVTYIIGLSYHQAYLSEYGVPLDIFPKQPSDYLLYAYIATITALINIPDLFSSYKAWLTLTALFAAMLIYTVTLTLIFKSKTTERMLKDLDKRRKTGLTLAIAILSASASGLTLTAPLAALLILILPVQLGGYSAKLVANKERESFKLGCKPQNNSREYCYSLKDNFSTIKEGYIIATSPTHIAIYNKEKSYIYLLSGKSIEITSSITHE